MEYTTLGTSEIKIARLGFGCCPMGGHGWGEVDFTSLSKSVSYALEIGNILFDTADIYGLGCSENFLGVCLKGKRDKAIVATKFGVRFDEDKKTYYDISLKWLDQALEDSLRRLGTDYIDLYQVHYPDGITNLSELRAHLDNKIKDGKIREFGVSNFSLNELRSFGEVQSIQLEYSLARRDKESDVNKLLKATEATLFTWGSLGQGILSGKYLSASAFNDNDRRSNKIYKNFYGPSLSKNISIVETLQGLSLKREKSISQLALRWILDLSPRCVPLVGIKSLEQFKENLGALDWKLEEEDRLLISEISNPLPIFESDADSQ